MIRVMRQYAVCAVQLLGEQHPHQRVRQRQARQGQREIAARQHPRGEPVRAPDHERQVLSLLHAPAEPVGELAGGELSAALIEGNDVVPGMEGMQQPVAFGSYRLLRPAPGTARTRLDLGERDREAAPQAAQIVLAGAAYPGRHARAHGDHAHAHFPAVTASAAAVRWRRRPPARPPQAPPGHCPTAARDRRTHVPEAT